jgi:hypothetical protein
MSRTLVEAVSIMNWPVTTEMAAPTSRRSVRSRVPASVEAAA